MFTTSTLYKKSKAIDGRTVSIPSNWFKSWYLNIIRGERWGQEARNISKSIDQVNLPVIEWSRSTLNSKDKQENGCETLSPNILLFNWHSLWKPCLRIFWSEFFLIYGFEKEDDCCFDRALWPLYNSCPYNAQILLGC